MSDVDEPLALPPLQRAVLGASELEDLFFDLEAAAELLGVTVKPSATGHALPGAPSLAEAHDLLVARQVAGVQIRYRYQDAEWWDTLLLDPGGVQLIRVQHSR